MDDSPYFKDKKFIPKLLADELASQYSIINVGDSLHVYQNGVYTADAEKIIRRECRKRLIKESSIYKVDEVVSHIADMTHIEVEMLNQHKHLLNLTNGMYNLKTPELLPHRNAYLSTIRIPIAYNPEATCPEIDRFFETTLPHDCIPIIEELFGYILMPDVSYEKAFMLTGIGANGKSTFLKLLEAFIGSKNVSKVPLQELDNHRFKRAELFGKLVNVFADLDSKALQTSNYFKTIVSGDPIDAERKFRDPFSFRPHARLVFSANEIPRSWDKTFAYYRRWIIIRFPYSFTYNADRDLTSKLIQPSELSGLLNRAIKGLSRLYESGEFSESETVLAELEEYKKQNDSVLAFMSDWCTFDINAIIERTLMYQMYLDYCEGEGYKPVSKRLCYSRLRSDVEIVEKTINGVRYFSGVTVNEKIDRSASQARFSVN